VSSWYFNKNLKPQGPLGFEEMKKKIMRGEIGPGDLICRVAPADGGNDTWAMAVEWRDFPKELFPAFQQNYFKRSNVSEKEWILLSFKTDNPQGSQEGPYSVEDVNAMVTSGLVSAEDYIWRSGLSGWVQIRERKEFLTHILGPTTSSDL
jgi:hypothetical protein